MLPDRVYDVVFEPRAGAVEPSRLQESMRVRSLVDTYDVVAQVHDDGEAG